MILLIRKQILQIHKSLYTARKVEEKENLLVKIFRKIVSIQIMIFLLFFMKLSHPERKVGKNKRGRIYKEEEKFLQKFDIQEDRI